MTVDIWSVLLLYGVCQGALLTLAIPLRRSSHRAAYVFLAALVLVVSLNLLSYLVVATDLYREWPHLIAFFQPFLFLIGPLYFLHVSSLVTGGYRARWLDALHLTPFALALIFRWPFLSAPAAVKIAAMETFRAAATIEMPIAFYLYFSVHVVQTLVYVLLAHRALATVTENCGAGIPGGLPFLTLQRRFARFFGAYWVASLIALTLLTVTQLWTHAIDYTFVLIQSFIIHGAGYLAVKAQGTPRVAEPAAAKPAPVLLGEDESAHIVATLRAHMDASRPFLGADLTLTTLAAGVGLPPHVVSHVLNRHIGANFADFVNRYRVREVQRRLLDPASEHLTILALALESGFSSKASFNRAFKKHTGRTPSRFKRERVLAR